MKIAVVGGGISGLVTAYVLGRDHDVTVFEANDYAGGHTNTVPVETVDGAYQVDTGFIVFNETNYPLFTRLLGQLGVESQPTTMSFSVKNEASGLEWGGGSLGAVFAQKRNVLSPRFLGMLRDIFRFNKEAAALGDVRGDETTVAEYVAANGYGAAFAEQFLIPLAGALWSCPAGMVREFPIRFVVEFLNNHAMLTTREFHTWRVIRGGSQRYVERLTAGFRERIRLGAAVRSIRRSEDAVEMDVAGHETETFDEVVIASHSDQALRMLADADGDERAVLEAFPYKPNAVTLHQDASPLPRKRAAWSSWNYQVPRAERGDVSVTYNMNLLQTLGWKQLFNVTLNDSGGIDGEKVRGRFEYAHPVFTAKRQETQARHGEFVRRRRTSFCGAYWGYGFHEDGVRSALAVCAGYGLGL